MSSMVEKLSVLVGPLVTNMGYEFVGCELQKDLLRLYIDREGGVSVGDCEKVSRQISALLDVEDPFQHRYMLEVSSPGLDRPIFTFEQLKRFLQKTLQIRLYAPLNGRRQFTGKLLEVRDEKKELVIQEGEEPFVIPYLSVAKATVSMLEDDKL